MPVMVGTDPLADEGFATAVATQAFLGGSGIVLGGTDTYGVRWKWKPANAWGSKPAPREQVGDREYDHGQWDATRYYGPRVLAIPGTAYAPTHADLHAAEQRLRDAVTLTPFVFRVVEPGFDGYAMMRQQGEIDWTENSPRPPHASFSIGLYARDPLIYSTTERTFDLDFPLVTGGRSRPRTLPGGINAEEISGSEVLLNPSAFAVGLEMRIDGPAETAVIAYPELGQALYLENPDGPLLTAGQWLDINTATRQVLLNGDAGRRSWVYGDWLLLPPGTTTLAIAGTGTTSDSHVSGTYRAVRL